MANQNHTDILKQGVKQWNKWREENESIRPDLEGATLRGVKLKNANLTGANLRRTDLRHANLNGADLYGADLVLTALSNADLSFVNLSGFDLDGTGLNGANLSFADLSKATLRGADLSHANLTGAKLRGTDLRHANLNGADLSGLDLSGVDLSHANLNFANLFQTNLNGAILSDASLLRADLMSTDLRGANLSRADLTGANLSGFDLSGTILSGACLRSANLSGNDLSGFDLRDAYLSEADLKRANLTGADLTDADLSMTSLVGTNLTNATITGCRIYGISAWNVTLKGAAQHNLIISKVDEPDITVDNLEVGQFIYLMLNNTKIRDVINTITAKGVLILGRFSDPKRKSVLDGLREKLREFDLLPMVFDFDRPTDKDYTETVQMLATMSMFVIADVTNAKSTPLELEATVKQFKIPYVPIIDVSVDDPHPFSMLGDLQKSFHWILDLLEYESPEELLDDGTLQTLIIDRVNAKREELRKDKNREPVPIRIRKKRDTSSPS